MGPSIDLYTAHQPCETEDRSLFLLAQTIFVFQQLIHSLASILWPNHQMQQLGFSPCRKIPYQAPQARPLKHQINVLPRNPRDACPTPFFQWKFQIRAPICFSVPSTPGSRPYQMFLRIHFQPHQSHTQLHHSPSDPIRPQNRRAVDP